MEEIQDKEAKKKRAHSEYKAAELAAKQANTHAQIGSTLHKKYTLDNYRLENWNSIMSTQPVVIFFFIFIIVAITEYLISKEIYREFLPNMPWVVAIGFFVLGIVISELLVYHLIGAKRKWKKFEMKNDPNSKGITEDEMEMKIRSGAKNFFLFGLIMGVLLLAAIFFLSKSRVDNELSAGMRVSPFGIMDIMPILLYAIEIFVGIYMVFMIKKFSLQLKVKRLKKKISENVKYCSINTQLCVKKYHDAEKENFDPLESQISNDVHEAFYRNYAKNVANESDYISSPEPIEDGIVFQLIDENGNPINKRKHITVISDYKYTATATTDAEGKVRIRFEKTYPEDSIRKLFIRESSNDVKFHSLKSCNYDLNFIDEKNPVLINLSAL